MVSVRVDVEVGRSVSMDSDERIVGLMEGRIGSVDVDSGVGGFVVVKVVIELSGVGDEQAWRMRDRMKKRRTIF